MIPGRRFELLDQVLESLVDDVFEFCAALIDVLACKFLLQIYELVRLNDCVSFCEFEVELQQDQWPAVRHRGTRTYSADEIRHGQKIALVAVRPSK